MADPIGSHDLAGRAWTWTWGWRGTCGGHERAVQVAQNKPVGARAEDAGEQGEGGFGGEGEVGFEEGWDAGRHGLFAVGVLENGGGKKKGEDMNLLREGLVEELEKFCRLAPLLVVWKWRA